MYSILDVSDTVSVDGEDCFSLWQARTVIDLADPLLSSSLPEVEPRGGGVGHDVAANGLLGVGVEHGGSVHLGNNLTKMIRCFDRPMTFLVCYLVGEHNTNSELVCELEKRPEELRKMHLPGGELSPAAVVRPEQREGGRTMIMDTDVNSCYL